MTLEFNAAVQLGSFSYEAAFDAAHEIVVLFGHSGAGKSLSLQIVSGLVQPRRGRMVIDGVVAFDSARGIDLPPQRRNVGYVVQDLALFPRMTVAENVSFALPRGPGRDARLKALLAQFGLEEYAGRMPRSLSGGQQQRVALARALGRDARTLLLDEPFSALDESLRASLRRELLRLRQDLGLTVVFVTHDLREAHLLADRMAVFDAGRVLQFDDRETIFRRPRDRRVAELTGVSNVFRATVLEAGEAHVVVDASGAILRCAGRTPGAFGRGDIVDVAIRAERVNLRRHHEEQPGNAFEAVVVEEYAYGSAHTLHLRPLGPGPFLESELAARPYEVLGVAGQKRWLVELAPADLHVMAVREQKAPESVTSL